MVGNNPGLGINFNLSHSRELAVICLTLKTEIGVDLEFKREIPELEGLLSLTLSRREKEFFHKYLIIKSRQGLAQGDLHEEKKELFYSFWTHKEAYVKAKGDGFHLEPQKVEFYLSPKGELKLLSKSGVNAKSWLFYQWEPESNYLAALAIFGKIGRENKGKFGSSPSVQLNISS
jgi:4'-phosphopantetheinyl transferase